MRKSVLLSGCVFILLSCSRPDLALKGINLDEFKSDKFACKSARTSALPQWEEEKEKLKALSEMEIIRLLGRPDENELYTRNQKFYRYYLEPGPSCEAPHAHAKQLVIRFNAIGLAKEVTIE